MTEMDSVKGSGRHAIVGVITSRAELKMAARLSKPPDLLELRLDHLATFADYVELSIPRLPAPLIMTARDFSEGGARELSVKERSHLLLRFMPYAAFVDIEMKSMRRLASIFKAAHARKIQRILSVHDWRFTPHPRALIAKAYAAKSWGAEFFKVVTRVETPRDLARLLTFMEQRPTDISISVMGVGKLGAISRLIMAACGSALTYAHLSRASVEGQPSLSQVRRAFALFGLYFPGEPFAASRHRI